MDEAIPGGRPVASGHLDAVRLAEALRAGIHRVFRRQDHLDRINVFPVADGDTGTNLAMTLRAVLQSLDREPAQHAGRLLTRIADAALDGARGNSGAILAQFLLGLGDRLGQHDALAPADFAAGVASGAAYAREALTEPREGTLLTVLRESGEALERLAAGQRRPDFRLLLAQALPLARASLERTRGQLDALRAADVVDAGAQGFVELLEGVHAYFETGETGEAVPPHAGGPDLPAIGAEDTTHRFCTECVISGAAIDQRRLREQLAAHGSSLVVAGTHRKVRVHVHTNAPEEVFRLARAHGVLTGEKADDMLRQQAAVHHARNRHVAVVTDSAADVPEDALERLELHTVPVRVHFGARSYLDKVSVSLEEFYRELARSPEHPKTSQPPPGDFRRLFEFLLSHYESVVSVNLSSRVSGTCNAARSAAARLPAGRVTVIDSGNASLGQGLLAVYAAECAQAGYGAEEVAAAVRAAALRTRTFGLLARLDFAVRGGRVSPLVKRLAELFGFAPVIANLPGGRIGPGGIIFGRRALRPRFAAFVRRRMRAAACYRIAVGHADAEAEGRALLAEITAGLPNVESTYLAALGTALGVHGGPGMLVVGVQEYEPPRRARVGAPPDRG